MAGLRSAAPHRALAAAAALLAAALAGCTGPAADPVVVHEGERPPIAPGLGAIAGLLVDDRYRPVPGARVVLFPLGLEATTDGVGQFGFAGLEPGAYQLRAEAEGHEAAPVAVDVEEGLYAEAEIEARRTFSDLSDTITEQHSIFVPCAVSAIVVTGIMKCVLDGDDSYDWGFSSNYTAYNATFAVSEFLASQHDGYYIDWSCDGPLASQTFEGTYTRLVLEVGGPTQNGTVAWTNDCEVRATLFYVGSASDTAKQAGFGWGAGVRFAVKGTFLNTVFVGPPEADPIAYGALRPKGQA